MIYNISLQEYPGEVCLIFYQGTCNLKCGFCFNKLDGKELTFNYVVESIKECREFITSVCLTGGEPFMIKDFSKICKYINDSGLKLKVNTNGCYDYNDIEKNNLSFKIDYLNIGIKEESSYDKIKNLLMWAKGRVDFTIVYHKWLNINTDLLIKNYYDFIGEKIYPDNIIFTQLKVGECNDDLINNYVPPNEEELVDIANVFISLCNDNVIVETREYGKKILGVDC